MKNKTEADPHSVAMWGHAAGTIRAALALKDMTAVDLARQTGFSYAAVNHWLNCKTGISAEGREKVAKVLGLDERDLLPADGGAVPVAPRKRPWFAGPKEEHLPVVYTPPAKIKKQPCIFEIQANGKASLQIHLTDVPTDKAHQLVAWMVTNGYFETEA